MHADNEIGTIQLVVEFVVTSRLGNRAQPRTTPSTSPRFSDGLPVLRGGYPASSTQPASRCRCSAPCPVGPPTFREVVRLRDIEHRPPREVARRLHISTQNVAVRLHRAHKLLRPRLLHRLAGAEAGRSGKKNL